MGDWPSARFADPMTHRSYDTDPMRHRSDETNIFIVGPSESSIYEMANKVLISVHNYMKANQLHINIKKSSYMHFRPNKTGCSQSESHTLALNGNVIEKVSQTKFLGVIIDDKLSWLPHLLPYSHASMKL